MRCLLEVNLAREGYVVEALADGRAIQEVAVSFRPDLVVLDVRLAVGPNGYELARELRTNSDVPILFLTVADDLEARLAGFGRLCGHGFRNFENYRLRVLLHAGGVS